MKKLVNLLPVAFCSLMLSAFVGCSEDADALISGDNRTSDRVSFWVEDMEDVQATTRGTQATLSALDAGFGVSCSVYPSSGTYTSYPCGSYFYKLQAFPGVETDYYWPETDSKMAFYAYYPYDNSNFTVQSAATANGAPTYAYTVPEAIASQVDVMTTRVVDRLASNHTAVPLTFSHRCTDIRFTAYNQQSEALTVTSIAIYGVKYVGTYTSGTSWSLSGSVNSSSSHPFLLSLSTAVASKATVDLTGTTNHFIMLPQTVANGTDFLVIKTQEDGEERTYTYTLDSSYELVMGKSVTFQLTLGNGTLTVSPVSVVDWEPISTVTNGFSVTDWQAQ